MQVPCGCGVPHLSRWLTSLGACLWCSNWLASGGRHCPHAGKCHFAHGVAELRPNDGPHHRKYKMRLCNNWLQSWGMFCPHADQCNFAHGVHELRRYAEKPNSK